MVQETSGDYSLVMQRCDKMDGVVMTVYGWKVFFKELYGYHTDEKV